MDTRDMQAILQKAQVCRLGLCDDGRPYVVPLCFGYDGQALYFHSAPRGRKIEILRRNNNVCVEVDIDTEMVPADEACRWSIRFRSVVGFGKASFVEDGERKKRALRTIMAQYSNRDWELSESAVARTVVVRVEIESMTGRSAGY